jgi:hypothetical protein
MKMKIDIDTTDEVTFDELGSGDVFVITKHRDEHCVGPYLKCSQGSKANCVNLKGAYSFSWETSGFGSDGTRVRKINARLVNDPD